MKEICISMIDVMVAKVEYHNSLGNKSQKENREYLMGSYHTLNGVVRTLRDNFELDDDEFGTVCNLIDNAVENLLESI